MYVSIAYLFSFRVKDQLKTEPPFHIKSLLLDKTHQLWSSLNALQTAQMWNSLHFSLVE